MIDFEDWWNTAGAGTYDDAKYTWQAAQQAEREKYEELLGLLTEILDLWHGGTISTLDVYRESKTAIDRYKDGNRLS